MTESRIVSGTGNRVQELQMPASDWAVLNEIAQDMPESLRLGDEAGALDWLETRGKKFAHALSPALHEAMTSVRDGTDSSVLLITTEDPEAQIGFTPNDHLRPDQNRLYKPDLCRGVLVGAFALHGYGYTSQQHGVIFNNMVVAESQRTVPNVASSVQELGFHTEDAAFAEGNEGGLSPDLLSLHYFRNREQVSTPVSVPDISKLDDDLVKALCEEKFHIPNSLAQGGDAQHTKRRVSVLFGDRQRPFFRFNAALMPLTPEAQLPGVMEVIDAFCEHLRDQATTLVMQPGDILFINNRQAAHGKGKHEWEAEPGFGRWQRRLALAKDLGRLAPYFERPRIVSPERYRALIAA